MSRMEILSRSLRGNRPSLEVPRSRGRRGATRGLPVNLSPSAGSCGVLQKHLGNLKYSRELVEMLDKFPNFRLQIEGLRLNELKQMLAYMDSSTEARRFRYEIKERLEKVGKEHPVTLILGKRESEYDALVEELPREESSVYIWRKIS